jgi:hypothetical protein
MMHRRFLLAACPIARVRMEDLHGHASGLARIMHPRRPDIRIFERQFLALQFKEPIRPDATADQIMHGANARGGEVDASFTDQ